MLRFQIRHQSLGTLLAKYKGDSCVAGVLTTDIRLKKTGSSGDLVVVAFTSGTSMLWGEGGYYDFLLSSFLFV